MERGEKSDPIPSGPYPAASHAPPPGYEVQQQRPVQYPPPPGGYPPPAGSAYYHYPSPASGFVANQPPPPAYQQQQTTGVVVVGSAPPVSQNVVVVQTVRANVQIPDVYPGIAFCQFAPGIIETLIRSSIVVMLLVLIAVAGATIEEESEIIYDDDIYFDARGWVGAAGWIIFAAGLSLITEGIMLLLRFLNPKCFNNFYGVFGGLDITKCVLSGIGLFIGCVITGVESAIAEEDLELWCDTEFRNPDNNDACKQLELIYRLVIALTAINAVCMALILALFIWDIIYLSAGFNSRIPVPRGTEEQQH